MKKKYILIILFIFLIIFIPNIKALNYTPSEIDNYKYYPYVIDKYNVDIIVNENNTLDITETITAYFNVSKHGIYRTIPLRNKITRLDGTKSINKVEISNLSVNNEYKTFKDDNNYKIQIGSYSKMVTGKQSYIIKYTYNLGKDLLKDKDELYYNIIGTEWDTVIGNVSFNITMPKDFDATKLGFSAGAFGSTDSSKVKYSVKGNVINGSYEGILDVKEGLTVRLELAEGYFVKTIDINILLLFLIPILLLIISIIIWYKYGRDNKVIETVEFYPPDDLNSLEIGLLYKGYATNKDVTSLLVYLANKGYIKLVETKEKGLFGIINNYKIIKLKEYDGINVNEQLFLNGLFTKEENSINYIVNEVTKSDLDYKFYPTMDKILRNINSKDNKNKIFENNILKYIILIIFMIISLITIIAIPIYDYAGLSEVFIAFMVYSIFIVPIAYAIFGKMLFILRIFWIGIVIPHIVYFSKELVLTDAIMSDSLYLIGFIIGIICLMIICFKLIPKRTSYGNEMLGKIRGFKNFLETAEKDKLEAMVTKDPSYFYNILSFTYVLDISDKWIKKFESIAMQPPTWYDSNTSFSITNFGTFMNSTMTSAQWSMSSNPSSDSSFSSGGSSSGGGSSGGGSGGGGGGSW